MAEVPTVEIHSPKNALQKWIINQNDYDPKRHCLWGEPEPSVGIDSDGIEFTQSDLNHASIKAVDEPDWIDTPSRIAERQPNTPSHPDFVSDSDGNIVSVNIIDPDRRTSRREIAVGDYDPDTHELWSTHSRFNR